MSEVEIRPQPARGRSSARGGRGGIGRGGPRGGRKPSATVNDTAQIDEILDDEGELADLKRKYTSELGLLKDMFPDWTDVDLLFALEESVGDISSTVDKITRGNVSQFAEVKSTKDRARSKVKEESTALGSADKTATRGTRGRGGYESVRGGRGRASDRGRGGFRGGRGGHAITNGAAAKDGAAISVPTTESSAWEATTATETSPMETEEKIVNSTKQVPTASARSIPATSDETSILPGVSKSSVIPEGGVKKSWASMFSQPKPIPVPAVIPRPAAPTPSQSTETAKTQPLPESTSSLLDNPAAAVIAQTEIIDRSESPPAPEVPPVSKKEVEEIEIEIAPSQVPLTEENVEHLPDDSNPPRTQTVLSTAGSMDTRNATPLPAQQTPISRLVIGGYAASAYRAAGIPTRSASFQRRVKEQQEAVVMPGHNAVDRAAVQFGSMGLNGEQGLDVDEDREDPETRQAPQASPPSQPRTSLPPAPRVGIPGQDSGETTAAAKQAPGLPPASAQNQQQIQEAMTNSSAAHEQTSVNQGYGQYGRYGQPGLPHDPSAQKAYDPFGHQAQPSPYDQYGSQSQQQTQQASHAGFGGLSSAPGDYSSYYTTDPSRNAYSQYYGSSYGQHDNRAPTAQTQQDSGMVPQRSGSGFGSGHNEVLAQQQQQQPAQHGQSRFGESPGSGQNTPNPLVGGQQQSSAQNPQHSQQALHGGQGQQQQQQPGGYGASAAFPYGHPYFNSPYQAAYQNQFGYSNVPAGYGGGYPGKGGMYGVPHGYGIGSQTSYDQHSSSPSTVGAYGQTRNASGLGGGLDDYSRATAQSGSNQQGGGFGGINDPFARSASGFGGQGGYGQQNTTNNQDESLKSFNDSKNGPSPAHGQPGRPGSAANSAVGSGQSGLPPPHSQQSGFGGGYPGFPGQASQYGGLGGLGTHQQGQQNNMGGQAGYGGYGAGGFNQTYGGYGSRGGWGSNYGAH